VIVNWATLELIKVVLLVLLAVGLHQLIRRVGKGYAAEVFEATPHIGRAFTTLADMAYYLIFVAYILFNINVERPARFDAQGNQVGFRWEETVSATQVQDSLGSIAGICLIIGLLHGINVFVLPFVGSVLALRAKLLHGRLA
jgi:hypothetical protein